LSCCPLRPDDTESRPEKQPPVPGKWFGVRQVTGNTLFAGICDATHNSDVTHFTDSRKNELKKKTLASLDSVNKMFEVISNYSFCPWECGSVSQPLIDVWVFFNLFINVPSGGTMKRALGMVLVSRCLPACMPQADARTRGESGGGNVRDQRTPWGACLRSRPFPSTKKAFYFQHTGRLGYLDTIDKQVPRVFRRHFADPACHGREQLAHVRTAADKFGQSACGSSST
jgi:hypothetical protein